MNILKKFTEKELKIINEIKKASIETNIKTYIVGGALRDVILNYKINDIDICLEGEPKKIIHKIKNIKEYIYYDEFHTGTIKFENDIQVDLIGCRKEKYEYEGALPKITLSNIKNDLERRDFTINALAYDIVEGKILDFFHGIEDLRKEKIVRIHNNSYMEDGTRIFRAIKYSIRYGFKIEDEKEIKESIKKGALNNVSNDRILSELYSLCTENNWIEAIKQCCKYNLLDINLDLLGLENILLDYSNIYVRILNVLYSIKNKHGQDIKKIGIKEGKEIGLILEYMKKFKINLGILDEEKFLIDNMGEINNVIKYKNP